LPGNARERGVNVLDKIRQVVHGDAIVADMGRDNVGGKSQQSVFGTFDVGHFASS
jgi:hypothetical protein